MRQLQGRVAVVTGAASGIGRATSLELAKNGCDLAISDINEEGLKETAKAVEALGPKVTSYIVDVADKERMQRFASEVVSDHGHVHILLNNAGVAVLSSLDDHDLDDYEWVVGINFWGVVYGCKFFIPYLKKESEGHIVNMSSIFGIIGVPDVSSYCATKFAVRGLSECLWHELRDFNIGVTSVHPGGVKTDIVQSARMDEETDTSLPILGPGGRRQSAQRLFDRIGCEPDKVARAIIQAIKANKMRILINPETYIADSAKRIIPSITNSFMQRTLYRMRSRFAGD